MEILARIEIVFFFGEGRMPIENFLGPMRLKKIYTVTITKLDGGRMTNE